MLRSNFSIARQFALSPCVRSNDQSLITPIVSAVNSVAVVGECASATIHCTGRVWAEMIPIVFSFGELLGFSMSLIYNFIHDRNQRHYKSTYHKRTTLSDPLVAKIFSSGRTNTHLTKSECASVDDTIDLFCNYVSITKPRDSALRRHLCVPNFYCL